MSAREALPLDTAEAMPLPRDRSSGDDTHQRRARRAAVAALLLARAPAAASTLDWASLDAAPRWLALPAPVFDPFVMRVGAVVSAPGMRLWIDAARLAAARGAVGDAFLRRLLAQPDLAGLPSLPRVASPAGVIPALQAAGAAVLLATLPSALRGVASAALPSPVPLVLNTSAAQTIVDRAVTLASESAR